MLQNVMSRLLTVVPRSAVSQVARRYIAGETMESAIGLGRKLKMHGYCTTIDLLGEEVDEAERGTAAASTYIALIKAMANAGIDRNVSIKLTQLGLRHNEARAYEELLRVLDTARQCDTFVRLDMEDSTLTDVTLAAYQRARKRWPRVGIVLQARLKRTLDDAKALAKDSVRVRLCKGIYKEPDAIAHQDRASIRASYLEIADVLLRGNSHVAFATHDQFLIDQLERRLATETIDDERTEFQALLGVPIRSTLERLREAGHTVRLYVPFGEDWYAYGMRRMSENPELAIAIARGLLSGNRLDASTAERDT